MIALLCPSKGRPEKLKRMIESARKTAGNEVRVYIALGSDTAKYKEVLGDLFKNVYHCPDLMPTAHKWNMLAQEAMKEPENKLFMVAGDDMYFTTPLWDIAITTHYMALDNKIHVYHLKDTRTGHGTPHPIMSREWINAMGYFVPPIFLHWFIDTWTVEIAKYCNCFTHLMDFELMHDKDNDHGKPDETHIGIRSYGWRERDTWVHEQCKNTIMVNEMQRLRSLVRK